MEDQKGVYARCCFSAPVSSFRIRSWCSRWLSCALNEAGRASFTGIESEASEFFVLPYIDGRYKLQLSRSAFHSKTSKRWYLCCRGPLVSCVERHPESDLEDVIFSLEFDEYGRMRLRGGAENRYLTTDWYGRLWNGTVKPKKWEMFTLVEQAVECVPKSSPWIVRAPVRVTLQAHTGKYLCAAKPAVCARAEAPCCCEEFLLDLSFSVLPKREGTCSDNVPLKSRGFSFGGLSMFGSVAQEEEVKPLDDLEEQVSKCTIRTADGESLLSAEPDGSVFTTPVDRAQGRETFSIELHPDMSCPKISIQQANAERRYLSAEFGYLINKRPYKRKSDYFNVQLANGSRVLVKSIHGGFLGVGTSNFPSQYSGNPRPGTGGVSRKRCSQSKQVLEGIGAWQLRSHGDSLYTLISASTFKRGADLYMYADSSGRIFQSSDPAVHFPSVASLFEVKPVTEACLLPTTSSSSISNRIIGFTIRTVRKINGKQRYLSVEPNGSVRALKLYPSRWELFQLIDVDATAAVAAPGNFSCMPAALNREPPSSFTPVFPRITAPASRTNRLDPNRSASLKACEVAAMALHEGEAVPRRASTSLQDLCIAQICCHASAEITESEVLPDSPKKKARYELSPSEAEFSELVSALCSLARRHELLPVSIPADLTAETAFNIPDDLLARIWATCRSRQIPRNSCKWLPSAFIPQAQAQGPRPRNNRFAARVHRGANTEGWHCSSCDHGNVLPMDATVNPAHHRYLEVQSRVYSRAIQSTGILWNIISLAGVSIMSTALFCQLKAAAGRRSTRNSF